MREGVLVLIKNKGLNRDTDIKFYNKSFLKIFDTLKREDTEIRVSDLQKPRFLPSKLLKENLVQHATEDITSRTVQNQR